MSVVPKSEIIRKHLGPKIPTLANPARMGHPKFKTVQRTGHPRKGIAMGIFSSRDYNFGILRLVLVNATTIALLGWIIQEKVVSLRLAMMIAYPLLFIFNFWAIWKARRDRSIHKPTRTSKRMRIVAILFTSAAVIEIIFWIQGPDVRSTIQAIVGIALAGWMWYLAGYRKIAKPDD
jgi:amino acid transporter